MTTFFTRALTLAVEVVCIVLLLTLTTIVVYSTTMRYIGHSPSWYDELAQVNLAWLTYFAAVYATLKRDHMGFAGLVIALPGGLRLAAFLLGELLVVAFFAVIAWYGAMILPIANFDSLLSLPFVSMGVVQSIIPVSAVLIILATLLTLPQTLAAARFGVDHERAAIELAIAESEADAKLSSSGKVAI